MNGLKNRKTVLSAAATMALAAMSATAWAGHLDGARFLKQAQVKLPQARAIALKAVHGKIVSEELEKELGGSGLRYSFDIKQGVVLHEVGVDARTGKVLENTVDDDAD